MYRDSAFCISYPSLRRQSVFEQTGFGTCLTSFLQDLYQTLPLHIKLSHIIVLTTGNVFFITEQKSAWVFTCSFLLCPLEPRWACLLCVEPSDIKDSDLVPMGCSCKAQLSQVLRWRVTCPFTTVVTQLVNVPPLKKNGEVLRTWNVIQVWSGQGGNEQVSFGCALPCWIQFY